MRRVYDPIWFHGTSVFFFLVFFWVLHSFWFDVFALLGMPVSLNPSSYVRYVDILVAWLVFPHPEQQVLMISLVAAEKIALLSWKSALALCFKRRLSEMDVNEGFFFFWNVLLYVCYNYAGAC